MKTEFTFVTIWGFFSDTIFIIIMVALKLAKLTSSPSTSAWWVISQKIKSQRSKPFWRRHFFKVTELKLFLDFMTNISS